MSNKKSKYSSVRVYRRFCFGAVFSGLCSLGIAGIFAAFLFMPVFSFIEGDVTVQCNGLNFVFYCIKQYFSNLYNGELDGMTAIIEGYDGGTNPNPLLTFLHNFHQYVELGILAFFAIAALLGVIIGICGLLYIFTGRNHNTRMASALSKSTFVFFALFLGLLFLYLFFITNMINSAGLEASITFSLIPFILAGGLLVLSIALCITYAAAFKHKVFAGKKKVNKQDSDDEEGETKFQPKQMGYQQPYPQQGYGYQQGYPQPMAQPIPQHQPGSLPYGLRDIGDHAFSKNLELKDASIPTGVTYLGPSAFSNCLNLANVVIPITVRSIGYNCFFNTPNLKKITYLGTIEDWKRIEKGSNWLTQSGTNIIDAIDGRISINS